MHRCVGERHAGVLVCRQAGGWQSGVRVWVQVGGWEGTAAGSGQCKMRWGQHAAIILPFNPAHNPPDTWQVLTEVYAQRPLPLPEHVGVSLVLHMVVDGRQEVRDGGGRTAAAGPGVCRSPACPASRGSGGAAAQLV